MSISPVTAIIVGAGNRAMGYSAYASDHPYELKIVGVVDPSELRRNLASERFRIPIERCFSSVEELVRHPKMSDAIINGTMEMDHVSTAIPLMKAGYDMLLEKPFATDESDMWRLVDARRESGGKLMICHVLRYAPFYKAIKDRVNGGQIGEIINIQTNEHVSYHHMAVAFVRGKWKSQAETGSSMLMAKCCHDLDLIMWMKSGFRPVAVSSFGSNTQFRVEQAPDGAGTRCIVDCEIEEKCIYSARKHYLDHPDRWRFYVWNALDHDEFTREERFELLKTSDYGRCVWRSDNDLVDHQSVAIEFDDGTTATHNMVGGSARPTRTIHIIGTTGEIHGVFEDSSFVVRKIDPRPEHEYSEEIVDLNVTGDMHGSHGGHGGGDQRLVADFVQFVRGETPSSSCTNIEDSINGHLVGFRADKAMNEKRVVSLDQAV